ncbi:ClpXP protease specificity-enhancing factor [Zoogloea oleivorans]|uniref:ClpXP protease specificity-enhancing factor n=1 Tax=Zoogloea oleivorans TaxID=1552750 RepID=A0A6C2CT46_9RHOO|nr:ClpXP protease specificity-enhancing factor [Zoogloea oleivorans]TYC56632.1 ClpXP protease specificity-enhancing factor [Zoogloea oleivorans]
MSEISTKPYLIRAIFQWCVDQGFAPYLAVAVDNRTTVPRNFVQDGQIVLNISPDATQSLVMGNELIAFQARFGGIAQNISVPVDSVSAIYARENGHGMAFEVSALPSGDAADTDVNIESLPSAVSSPLTDDVPEPPKGGGRSHLKLVK